MSWGNSRLTSASSHGNGSAGRALPSPKLVTLDPSERAEAAGKGHTLEGPEWKLIQQLGEKVSANGMVNPDVGFLEYSVGNAVEGMALTESSNPDSGDLGQNLGLVLK